MGVGGRKPDRQGNAAPINDHVVLRSQRAPVHRVRAGFFFSLLAQTLSRIPRLQSMAASSPSRFNSLVSSRSQTPAARQSRRWRQQVTPLPQPSSCGNSRHGPPVGMTKMTLRRAAMSGILGQPPLDLGGDSGGSGLMASQRLSGTRDGFFLGEMMSRPGGSENALTTDSPPAAPDSRPSRRA
jgi:hypothetical protein